MLNHVDVLTVQISTILSVKHKTTDSDDIGGGGGQTRSQSFPVRGEGIGTSEGSGGQGAPLPSLVQVPSSPTGNDWDRVLGGGGD